MTLKERVEENVVLWLLGSLFTGFLSGIAAFRSIQEIGDLQPIPRSEYNSLKEKALQSDSLVTGLQQKLNATETQISKLQEQVASERTTPKQAATSNPPRVKRDDLTGSQIRLIYRDSSTSRALEIKKKLESYGAHVVLSEPAEKCPGCAAPGKVEFDHVEDAALAVSVLNVVKQYGFDGTAYGRGGVSGVIYLDLDVGK